MSVEGTRAFTPRLKLLLAIALISRKQHFFFNHHVKSRAKTAPPAWDFHPGWEMWLGSWIRQAASLCPALFLSMMCWLAAVGVSKLLLHSSHPSAALLCQGAERHKPARDRDHCSQPCHCWVQHLHWACCSLQHKWAKCSRRCSASGSCADTCAPFSLPLFGALARLVAAKYKQIQYLNLSNLVWWKCFISFLTTLHQAVLACHSDARMLQWEDKQGHFHAYQPLLGQEGAQ